MIITTQLCCACDEPTGRGENDSLNTENGGGPFCLFCFQNTDEGKQEIEDGYGDYLRDELKDREMEESQ